MFHLVEAIEKSNPQVVILRKNNFCMAIEVLLYSLSQNSISEKRKMIIVN